MYCSKLQIVRSIGGSSGNCRPKGMRMGELVATCNDRSVWKVDLVENVYC